MSEGDPFPKDRLAGVLRRVPAYARLAWRLAREPVLSRLRRAAVAGAVGYLASPIDLVPGVIPIVGQLDDLAVALAAIRFALAGLDPERRRAHLAAVGLHDGDVTADLRTVGATTAWILRAGGRTAGRAARAGGRAALGGASAAAGVATRARTAIASGIREAAPRAGAVIRRIRRPHPADGPASATREGESPA